MKTPASTAPQIPHQSPLGAPPAPGMPLDTRLRTALQSGQTLHGIFCGLPLPALIEMSAFAGFDFVVIDNEHGMAGFETTEHLLRAARASGIAPIVRCFEADIPRVLDAGASGVQIPMVQSPEQAQRLVHSVRYPQPGAMPGQLGMRGSAFSTRAAGYGAFGGPGHTARSNASVACIAMIETPQAVACAGEIAAIPGIDAVFIGPTIWPTPWAMKIAGKKNRFKKPSKEPFAPSAMQANAPAYWPSMRHSKPATQNGARVTLQQWPAA